MFLLRWARHRTETEETAELVEETRHVLEDAGQAAADWKHTARVADVESRREIGRQARLRQRLQSGEEFVISDLFPDIPRGARDAI